jgi:hypothetical protein
MTEPDGNAGLRHLRQSLTQMKALLAWEQLKQSEAEPGRPPAFAMHDPTADELRNEYSFFVAAALDVHAVLNDRSPCLSEVTRESLRRQLAGIEREAYSLNLHQRFWGVAE